MMKLQKNECQVKVEISIYNVGGGAYLNYLALRPQMGHRRLNAI